jgi:DNA-binding XRE family transcriptional regulator
MIRSSIDLATQVNRYFVVPLGELQPIPENGVFFHWADFFTILQAFHCTAMSEINRIIRGRKLTKYRELRDLTKEDMATRLGVSPNTYGRYEKGEFEPKVDQWEKMADILNVPWMPWRKRPMPSFSGKRWLIS